MLRQNEGRHEEEKEKEGRCNDPGAVVTETIAETIPVSTLEVFIRFFLNLKFTVSMRRPFSMIYMAKISPSTSMMAEVIARGRQHNTDGSEHFDFYVSWSSKNMFMGQSQTQKSLSFQIQNQIHQCPPRCWSLEPVARSGQE